jgi:hypothetical protein
MAKGYDNTGSNAAANARLLAEAKRRNLAPWQIEMERVGAGLAADLRSDAFPNAGRKGPPRRKSGDEKPRAQEPVAEPPHVTSGVGSSMWKPPMPEEWDGPDVVSAYNPMDALKKVPRFHD